MENAQAAVRITHTGPAQMLQTARVLIREACYKRVKGDLSLERRCRSPPGLPRNDTQKPFDPPNISPVSLQFQPFVSKDRTMASIAPRTDAGLDDGLTLTDDPNLLSYVTKNVFCFESAVSEPDEGYRDSVTLFASCNFAPTLLLRLAAYGQGQVEMDLEYHVKVSRGMFSASRKWGLDDADGSNLGNRIKDALKDPVRITELVLTGPISSHTQNSIDGKSRAALHFFKEHSERISDSLFSLMQNKVETHGWMRGMDRSNALVGDPRYNLGDLGGNSLSVGVPEASHWIDGTADTTPYGYTPSMPEQVRENEEQVEGIYSGGTGANYYLPLVE